MIPNVATEPIRRSRYLRHRFPPEIISHAVWLYHRDCLSFRDVEDLLAERGIIVSYETIRQWCGKFGLDYARRLKRRQGRLGDTWFLDEVFVAINGQRQYLWRAVDQDGDLIDLLVQPRRDGRAARRFFRKLLKSQATGTVSSRDRQAGQLPSCPAGRHALCHPRHDPIREQSRRSILPREGVRHFVVPAKTESLYLYPRDRPPAGYLAAGSPMSLRCA